MQSIQNNQIIPPASAESIAKLVNDLSAAILAADAEDLAALATAHTCFQQISAQAGELGDAPWALRMEEDSKAAETVVEQIILQDAEDPAAALKSLTETVTAIQGLLREANGEAPVAPAKPKKVEAVAAATGTHVTIEAEAALNPDDIPLAQEFIGEANSHIESAETNLLKLEENPGDLEAVNAIFRSFHTVKGVAGFLNFKQIGSLAHAAENLLDLIRKGQIECTGARVDVVLESIDQLKSLLASLEAAIKAQRPMAIEPRLPELLHKLHTAADATGKVVSPAPAAVVAPTADSSAAVVPVTESPAAAKAVEAKGEAAHGDGSVKVSTERLDSLINMVGELVIAQSMVSQDTTAVAAGNHRLLRNLSHLGKITRELQDLSMSMRMVPIQGVFQKMARVVRDTSRKAGKEVEFVVAGGETELDRNVVEAIGDPLVHMVRNSLDHGIEAPDQRVAAGKGRTGRLELRARHQAGHIVIEIVDDGRGLNTAKIRKKALEAGIIKESDELSDAQIWPLIFAAGLSTADKITDISGRGVGMDVVRKNVEALRGRIEIASEPGKGATFSIHLPLTLAVIDGMVVRVGSERYIIPITSIVQSLRPKEDQLSTVQSRGEVCNIRGRLMPLTRLHRIFKVAPRTEDPLDALVVIVQDNQRHCCVLVDELLGQQQVVIKSLGEDVGAIQGVSGAAILGDGSVSLILDVPGLIDLTTK